MMYEVWPDADPEAVVTVDADYPSHAAQRYGATQGLRPGTPVLVWIREAGVGPALCYRVLVPVIQAIRVK